MVRVLAFALPLALIAMTPQRARACSPFTAEVTSMTPAGAAYPANAAIVVRGHQLHPAMLTATVDGAAATVSVDEALSIHDGIFEDNYTIMALRLEPAPAPGQLVTLAGEACADACAPLDMQFTAGPPDDVAPAGATVISFDLLRLTGLAEDSCGESGSLIFGGFAIPADAIVDEAGLWYRVVAAHEGAGLAVEERGHGPTQPLDGGFNLDTLLAGDAFPVDGWCLTVHTMDAAGNAGTPVESCAACLWAEVEPDTFYGDDVWSPVPGGACDDSATSTGEDSSTGGDQGSSSTQGDPTETDGPPDATSTTDTTGTVDSTSGATTEGADLPDKGCACSGAAPNSPWWLLAIVLVPRRRRSFKT